MAERHADETPELRRLRKKIDALDLGRLDALFG